MHPRVTAGKRYAFEDGQIEIDSIVPITLHDITPELARACGFKDVDSLMRVAKHGHGENVYLVDFHYVPRTPSRTSAGSSRRSRKAARR
jgi:hypothetical protein